MQQFDAGITGFRAVLDTLSASINQEREALRLEKDRLDQQRREFEEEQAVVAQVGPSKVSLGARLEVPCMELPLHTSDGG